MGLKLKEAWRQEHEVAGHMTPTVVKERGQKRSQVKKSQGWLQ